MEELNKKIEEKLPAERPIAETKPIPPQKPKKKISISAFSLSPRISLAEQILFAKHLSIMLKSGISEVESLRIIQEQIKSKGFKRILSTVIENIENGQFLSDSLAKFKRTFGELFINIIRLGEVSGTLPENLNYLAAEIRKKYELKGKIRAALLYPLIVLFATIGVAGALILFVLPKILPIFNSLGVKIPITTKILIAVVNIVNNYYIWILLGILTIVIIWIFLLRIEKVRYVYSRVMLFMPIVGGTTKDYTMTNITRTMGLLLRSGVKIIEALKTTSETVTNLVYRKALSESAEGVKKGEALYKHLKDRPDIFPTTASRMIEIGERTGSLDENLIYLAEFYESELSEKVKNLSNVLEPILMVIMGLLVGFVAISIITPIYEITQGLQR
ncbi:MAG TPA: type II secretion system F family protein [Candidatus Paceibacterota bacterium]